MRSNVPWRFDCLHLPRCARKCSIFGLHGVENRTRMNTEPGVKRNGADSADDPHVHRRYSHDAPRRSDESPNRPEMPTRLVSASVSEVPCISTAQWESTGSASLPSSGDSNFHTAPREHLGKAPTDTPGPTERETSPVIRKHVTCLSETTYEGEHNAQLLIEQQTCLEETNDGCKVEKSVCLGHSTKTQHVQVALDTISPVNHMQEKITAAVTEAEVASRTAQESVELAPETTKASTALESYALSIVQDAISSAASHLKERKPLNSTNLCRGGKIKEIEEAEGQESPTNQDAKETTDDNFCDKPTLADIHGLRERYDATMADPSAGRDISCRESHPLLSGDLVDAHALLSPRKHRLTSPTNTDRGSPSPARLSVTPSMELDVRRDGGSSPPAKIAPSSHEALYPLYTSTKRPASSTSRGDGATLSLPSRALEDEKMDSSKQWKRDSCAAEDNRENECSIRSETPVEHNMQANGNGDALYETISTANERDRIRRLRLAVETLVDEFKLEQELEALLKGNQPRTSSTFATGEKDIEMIRGVQSDMMEMLPPSAEESRAFCDEIRSILDSVKNKRRVQHVQGGENSVKKETSECGKLSPLSYVVKSTSSLVEEVSNNVDSHLTTGASEEQHFEQQFEEENSDLSDSLAEDTPVAVCYDSFMETIPLITEDVDSQDDDVVVITGTAEQVVTFDPWTAAVPDSKTTVEQTSREEGNGGFETDKFKDLHVDQEVKTDRNNTVSVEPDQESSRPQTANMADRNNAVSVERDQESSRSQTADMVDRNNTVSVERDQESSRSQTADMADGNNAVSVESDQESSRPQTADMADINNAVSVERDQESSRSQTADMADGNNAVSVEPDQESSRSQTADMADNTVPVEPDQQSSQTRPQAKMPGRARSPESHRKLTSTEDIVSDIQIKLADVSEGDSSERASPKPVSASRSHRQLELIQAESCASSEGKMLVRSRHGSDSSEAHRRSPLAMEDGGPFREEDLDRDSLGQTNEVVWEAAADSLPLLLDTDTLLPQICDEQISPNTVIKSMSDSRERRFMAVRDYRRSFMDREPILYRGDIVNACKAPNLPYYSLTSVDVLTFVPESYLRPLDLGMGDTNGSALE